MLVPSVLWRCWLGSRKGIWPVKNLVVGCWRGYLSGVGADLHMAQLMPPPLTVSCFSKIQIGFTFLVPVHPGSPGQRSIKWVCVCVCVRACVRACVSVCIDCFIKSVRVMVCIFCPVTTVGGDATWKWSCTVFRLQIHAAVFYREEKCADTIVPVLVLWAGHFQCWNVKIFFR